MRRGGGQLEPKERAMLSPAMIEVARVSYRYRAAAAPALSDISFKVSPGECFGLLGPNGAGKSTLFSLMTGALQLQQGEISLAGASIRTDLARVRDDAALAPQELAFYPALTGRQNLEFFCGAARLKRSIWRERIASATTACQLEDVLDRQAETYSGGLKRRLNLAIALLATPKTLYLDEPTVGIDAHSRTAIVNAIAELKQQGATIVYTSHYMEEVETLCDSIAVIDQGRLVACGRKSEILECWAPPHVELTLHAQPASDVVARLEQSGAHWLSPRKLTLPAKNDADIAPLLSKIAAFDLPIAQIHYGAARMEQAYLALLGVAPTAPDKPA